MRFILVLPILFIKLISSSFVGETLNNIHKSTLGGVAPLTINTESSINPTPVIMRRANIKDARYYANIAGASNCGDISVAEFNCEPYCRDILVGTPTTPPTESVKVTTIVRDFLIGVKGFLSVVPDRKEIILSLAGGRVKSSRTAALASVLTLLDVNSPNNNNTGINTKAVAVHGTIYGAAQRIFDQYKEELNDLLVMYPDYKVLFTGHSIGADVSGLSAIVAHHGLDIPWERIRFIGYGMIRIGNREFVRWLNNQSLEGTHILNYNDKVIQFVRPVQNFQYMSNEYFIKKDGRVRICDNHYFEDPDCNITELNLKFRVSHVHAFDTEFGIEC